MYMQRLFRLPAKSTQLQSSYSLSITICIWISCFGSRIFFLDHRKVAFFLLRWKDKKKYVHKIAVLYDHKWSKICGYVHSFRGFFFHTAHLITWLHQNAVLFPTPNSFGNFFFCTCYSWHTSWVVTIGTFIISRWFIRRNEIREKKIRK